MYGIRNGIPTRASFGHAFQAVKSNPLVVFMKGTPEMPQCGFSRAVCQIMDVQGVPREKLVTFNCLEDQELREGIKEYR